MAIDSQTTYFRSNPVSSFFFTDKLSSDENQIDFDEGIARIQLEKTTIETNRLVSIEVTEKKTLYQRENQVFFICLTLLVSNIFYNIFSAIYHSNRTHSLSQMVIHIFNIALVLSRKMLLKRIDEATINNDIKPKIKTLIMEDRKTKAISKKELKDDEKIITLNEERSKKLIKYLESIKKIGVFLLSFNIFFNIEQIYLIQAINNLMILIIWWKKTINVPKMLNWESQLIDLELKANHTHQDSDSMEHYSFDRTILYDEIYPTN